MAVDTRLKRQSATSLLVPSMTPGAYPDTAGVVVAERVAVTWCYSGIDPTGVACPADCKSCCYEIRVWIYYLTGSCDKYSCAIYNGIWILTQTGDALTDCEWVYTDPEYGFTITIDCEGDYWYLTIEHDGETAGRWRRALEFDPDCPPINSSNWNWVEGDCTGNAWAYTDCIGWDRPVVPPEWYPVGLRHGVYRMRLKWA